jgi:hypothetical protein
MLLFILLAGATASQAASSGGPSVRFGARDLTVTGLTPGGSAIVFAAGLQPSGVYSVTFKWSGVVEDTDKDGAVTVDVGRDVPGTTIWCVADAKTADFVVVTPGGRPVPYTFLRPGDLRKRSNDVSQLAFGHAFLDLLYLEPGGGAWTSSDSDGSATDEDGPNGKTTVSADRFKPLIASDKPLKQLRPGGILVAIDMIRLEVLALRLDGATLGSGQ